MAARGAAWHSGRRCGVGLRRPGPDPQGRACASRPACADLAFGKPDKHGVLPGTERSPYSARKAVVIGSRAARSAGNSPPTRPMPSAHFSPLHSSAGETLNWNTTWLKLLPSVDTL